MDAPNRTRTAPIVGPGVYAADRQVETIPADGRRHSRREAAMRITEKRNPEPKAATEWESHNSAETGAVRQPDRYRRGYGSDLQAP